MGCFVSKPKALPDVELIENYSPLHGERCISKNQEEAMIRLGLINRPMI